MALIEMNFASGGIEPTTIKTVSVTKTSFSGGTVQVDGLSKILAIFALLNGNYQYSFGGGMEINDAWQKIGFQDRTNGVSSVADDGSSFVWVDGTARNLTFVVLGIE